MDTDAVLDLLKRTAAEVIAPRFRALADGEVMEKGPGDLVTVADREAEVIIAAELSRAYPDALVLGEEAAAADPGLVEAFGAAEHSFTIDPIDGTLNFVKGSADHAVMVAELRDGRPVRSWIWQPELGHAFVAERGAGAYRDGVRLPALQPAPDPQRWRGASSQRSLRESTPAGLATVADTWWCCGVDYPRLAEGDIDYLVYLHTKPWDHAPGALLLEEVGGTVLSADGSLYGPGAPGRGLVAGASPALAEHVRGELIGLLPA